MLTQIRFAFRRHWRQPFFTAFVICFVGVGLGVGISVFSAFNALFLTPLPVSDPERLALIFATDSSGDRMDRFSYPTYRALRDRNRSFSGLLAYAPVRLETGDDTESDLVEAAFVSDNFFSVLGLSPARGRFFDARGEDAPAAVVVSESFWKRRLGAAEPLGEMVRLNGVETVVIGVAPRGFGGIEIGVSAEVWVPVALQPSLLAGEDRLLDDGFWWLHLAGRLKPEAGLSAAAADLNLVLTGEAPASRPAATIRTESLSGGGLRKLGGFAALIGLFGALGAATFTLVCLNLAQMTFAQALARGPEMAVRASLGATTFQVYRQLLVEAVILAVIAGAVGSTLTLWTRGFLLALVPPDAGVVSLRLPVDYKVAMFGIFLGLLVAAVSAATPALRIRKIDLASLLRSGWLQVRGDLRQELRWRKPVILAQIAVSVVLISCSALLLRSLANLNRDGFGLSLERIVYIGYSAGAGLENQDQGRQSLRNLLDRFSGRSDLEAVSLSGQLPFSDRATTGFRTPGYEPTPGDESNIDYSVVGPDYFEATGIPLLQGRGFDRGDDSGGRPVAVLNQAAAQRFWPGRSPIGQRFQCLRQNWEIVGTVGNAKHLALTQSVRPHLYLPILQAYQPNGYLVLKTAPGAVLPLPQLRREIPAADPGLRPRQALDFADYVEGLLWVGKVAAALLASFGAVTLLLALGGAYAVTLLITSRRRSEMAVRLALGATSAHVLWIAGRDWLRLGLPGAALGVAASLGLANLFSRLLYGVAPSNPLTHLGAALAVLAATAAASLAPVIQAARMDPATALRTH